MDRTAGEKSPMTAPYPWQREQAERLRRAWMAGRVPHAILLCGIAGLGKRDFARWLAALLLCESGDADSAPCGHCRGCLLLHGEAHPDLFRIGVEEGKRQLGIDAIRSLLEFTRLSSQYGGYRLALVHQADHMTRSAANSLLKTLEEPPAGAVLVLLADQSARLPPTVRSRCQQLRFAAPEIAVGTQWLQAAGAPEAAALLPACGQAPLAAQALHEKGAAELRRSLMQQLLTLSRGKASVKSCADSWQAPDLPLLLDLLIVTVQQIQRQSAAPGGDTLPSALAELKLDPDAAYGYLDYLYQTRALNDRALQPRLLVEDLLLRWRGIAAPAGRSVSRAQES
ncbi:DNA polymerase III subunit delta' [Methylonatrum kenyense]|uniref:DNA polymerase III subunit delta' n=1 Tax=Methylonatrum kenyense TaxID=455253 RepID=UPI0020C0EF00|nr:DNA polymerase III subunit delta' [Methylonatrum kenyense]MCK8516501.1 DNA polymerase III subunit delta' [Methylonatrum kenyense]